MDSGSLFIFNIFLNSLLAFLTTVLLIEGIIFLARIRQGRWAAFLRMIPIIKLPLDIWYYDFSRWSFLQGINPLLCEEGSRMLAIVFHFFDPYPALRSSIEFTAIKNTTFTIADVLSYYIVPGGLRILSMCLIGSSLFFLGRKIWKYAQFHVVLRKLDDREEPVRKILNQHIQSVLRKKKTRVIITSHILGSPFAAGYISKRIYIPKTFLKQLSQEEYEAVLAHEIEHIRNNDLFLRTLLDCIGSLFWWIPLGWFIKKIEEGQEMSCDEKTLRYEVDQTSLASAICKAAREANNFSQYSMAQHLSKHTICKRVERLLKGNKDRFRVFRFFGACIGGVIAFFMVFLGRFWIF